MNENFIFFFLFLQLLHAQTTGVTRTKVSMATVLAGLFPPRGTALEWNRRLNWQPIAIESEKLEEDSVSAHTNSLILNHFTNNKIDIFHSCC